MVGVRMSKLRIFISWVVGICFLISVVGIGYFYYQTQMEDNHAAREHTRQMTKKVLELSENLDRNGILAANILKNNAMLLERIDAGLATHTLELKEYRKYIIESQDRIHEEIERVFERLRAEFMTNREMHRRTQERLKIPPIEVK